MDVYILRAMRSETLHVACSDLIEAVLIIEDILLDIIVSSVNIRIQCIGLRRSQYRYVWSKTELHGSCGTGLTASAGGAPAPIVEQTSTSPS